MQAVIFIGIQATGKSTFFKEKFFDTHVRINLDMLRTRNREKLLLDACLEAGQNFVVDNTNPTVEDRKRYILPARDANFEIIGYYFDTQMNATLERNQARQDKQPIPVNGIQATYRKLQKPSFSEGFDKLYTVKINPEGGFLIAGWQGETGIK